jgi:prevent-host-death family protein
MSELSSREVREEFSETLNRVAYGHERIIITRRGRPLAVLVPVAVDQEQLEKPRASTPPEEPWPR